MAGDIDWLSVLHTVFKKYGTQLHRNQVKKFAAKVARKQGRSEDKKYLQKVFKSFLQTETGRSNVIAKDDMLSMGMPAPPHAQPVDQDQAQPPAQARLSLFDLAEAAAALSNASRQSSPAPSHSKPTKGKASAANGRATKQPVPAVPTGRRSARKGKGASSSPDDAAGGATGATAAPVVSSGMQTRGQATRRPSVEKQPGGPAGLLETVPAEATAASEEEPGPSAPQGDAVPGLSAALALQAAKAKPKSKKGKLQGGASHSGQPASHTQPPEAAARAAESEDDSVAGAVKPQHDRSQQTNSSAPNSAAAAAAAALPLEAAAEPAVHGRSDTAADQPEAVIAGKKKDKKRKKKRKHNEEPGAVEEAPSEAAVGAQVSAAAPVSESVPEEPVNKLKKKRKHKHSKVVGAFTTAPAPAADTAPAAAVEAAPAAEAAPIEEAAVSRGGDPSGDQADPGIKLKKKKTKKRKHSEAVGDAANSAPLASEAASAEANPSGAAAAATAVAAAATAAEASTSQRDKAAVAPDPAAAVKPKKRKLKHSKTQAQQALAAPSSTHLNAASSDSPSDEADKEDAAAVGHDSVHSEEPAPKAKKKRRSKAGDPAPGAEAAETAAAEAHAHPAEAAAGEAAVSAAAHRAKGRQSKASVQENTSAVAVQSSWRENAKRQDVKKGKFTKQEKDTLKQAAVAYAQEHGLPTADFSWLFCTRSVNSEYKAQAGGAWRSISESLPHRTNKSVYACGTRMLHERNYQGKWSKEEDEQLRQLVGEKGSKWAEISRTLSRLPEGCRDRWRELKLGDAKLNGRWSEDETERLRTLVNAYMTQKQANEEERSSAGAGLSLTLDDLESGSAEAEHTQSDGRIILDDIDWDLVSEQHGTRTAAQCLTKWYTQLAPSMVTKGEWGSGDDRRLLRALFKSGASQDFQVEWGQLVPSRTAQQARRRWRLMLKCVKDANDREFSDNLQRLVKSFTPDLLPPSPKPVPKGRTSKKGKSKHVAGGGDDAAAADVSYPGMSGRLY